MRLKRGIFWYYTTGESKNRDESVIVVGPKVKELKVGDTRKISASTWYSIYGRRCRLFDTQRRFRKPKERTDIEFRVKTTK
jgi:hypothetical protein